MFNFPFGGRKGKSSDKRDELKLELLRTVRPLQRGIGASEEDREKVDGIARDLEALNPNPKPFQMANGKWLLEYTTSDSILGTNKPPFLRPFGAIYQILDTESLKAENQETAPFFNTVSAELIPDSDVKVQVQFKQFKIFGILPVKAPASAKGELTITYVDEDLRISRGNRGNLFILSMEDSDAKL